MQPVSDLRLVLHHVVCVDHSKQLPFYHYQRQSQMHDYVSLAIYAF
jgi:hypothetical protein